MDVTRSLTIYLALLSLLLMMPFAGHAQNPTFPCSSIQKNLDLDARDETRMKCLKNKKLHVSPRQCLQIANLMEYSYQADQARQICLYELRKPLTIKECLQVTRAMELPDNADAGRWECLRRFSNVLSPKECRSFAQGMQYPANSRRAHFFCKNEL